jgi:hypothetical protein
VESIYHRAAHVSFEFSRPRGFPRASRRHRDSIPRVPLVTPRYTPPACARIRRYCWLIGALASGALALAQSDALAPSRQNFPVVGGNLANQRYSALTRITKANVSRLGGAWSMHLEEGKSPGTMQATPVVVDGVMFIASGGGSISALDAATGIRKWKHETNLPGPYRGVAVADGRRGRGRWQGVFGTA